MNRLVSLVLSGVVGAASVGGPTSPDAKTEAHVDFPGDLHRRNTASKGLGLCVFTSIHHAGLWQHEPAIVEMPKWLIDKGIPGGGYPSKVADLVPRLAKERGLPAPEFLQVEGNDIEILKAACKSGRMPCVTYSFSPTPGRYGGKIAHMVNLVHADDQWFCVLDNNYPGANQLQWMDTDTFRRVYTAVGGGWSIVFLSPGPPLPPRN